MTPRKPKSVQAHGPAGLALIASITAQLAEDGLLPDARDTELLSLAARLADRQVALEEMVLADGARMVTAAGIVRLHPAIGEARNTAVALAKVLAAVSMFEVTGRVKDPAKVRAATARWRVHNATRAAERTGRVPTERSSQQRPAGRLMGRRAPGSDDLPKFPAWISAFVADDWTDEADAQSELMDWNTPERARAVLAQGRWSAARRAYAAEHGLTVWDLPRTSGRKR